MTEITLHNSRTRRKERLDPIDPANVRMYVCGPTVYDRAHLGNARPVVVFDVLFRLLRHVYGADHVTYVRNFTDVDDKINARARQMQADGDGRDLNAIIRTLTDETIGWYHADMDALGTLRPTHEPRATDYIPQMVAMIGTLVDKGHAYAAQGHVLFAVDSWREGYGKLSGRTVDELVAGARVEVAPYKRNPMDFVLWKPSAPDEPGWPSPWGTGRPGWHIECSAMAHELLGESFDIHGGGIDLMFPHHENEIAQSCCAHPDAGFAKIWMHNEMVQIDGKKMSKSLGNFFTVRDLLEQGWPGEVIRLVMLQTHYRKPMDWTEGKARDALQMLDYFYDAVGDVALNEDSPTDGLLIEALKNDLNTKAAVDQLHGAAVNIHIMGAKDAEAPARLKRAAALLGLLRMSRSQWLALKSQGVDLSPLRSRLAALREDALQTKKFTAVDAMKAALVAAGIEVRMSKEGVDLVPGPDFDPSKLDALK